jgi:fructose/tagatose bisphosphate aldolase
MKKTQEELRRLMELRHSNAASAVPNKKKYDPRVWIRKGEETFIKRLKLAFEDLNNIGTLSDY